jgi:isoleucyl-tRNA synthetase
MKLGSSREENVRAPRGVSRSRCQLRDAALETYVEELLKLRGVIAKAVEAATQSKLISKGLEGAITLEIGDAKLLASLEGKEGELEEFFILSNLKLAAGSETKASLVRTAHAKCARCWRHRPSVGTIATHPELCDRCANVVGDRASA